LRYGKSSVVFFKKEKRRKETRGKEKKRMHGCGWVEET
jgi:hypothetical protein